MALSLKSTREMINQVCIIWAVCDASLTPYDSGSFQSHLMNSTDILKLFCLFLFCLPSYH
jgi:hypothetical protein